MSLFYLAWRYNIFFVTETKIDTRGLIYPRALKQLFAGIYIAEATMIGLFATSVAIGPIVLMVAFLIFTILFQITINKALDPLLYNLPRTLTSEENLLLTNGSSEGSHNGEKDVKNGDAPATAASEKKAGLFSRWLKPWQHANYETLKKLVPLDDLDVYTKYADEVERDAYSPPSVSSVVPLLWIPEDSMGISKQEVRDSGRVIPITDEGCTLTDKNKLEWDTESVRPPVWEEKIYY